MNEFENKEHKPELLYDNEKIIERVKEHPMATVSYTHCLEDVNKKKLRRWKLPRHIYAN